ncbi:MAG: hypothetical protein JWO72_1861 [Caulobacteraceae bacterium]|nr:hypothetical protein [Caulobacteraceae bacterium]
MTPLVLTLVSTLVQSSGSGAPLWNPDACKPTLDSHFVHSVRPAEYSGSPIRRLSREEAAREIEKTTPTPSCLDKGPLTVPPLAGATPKPPRPDAPRDQPIDPRAP